MKLVWILTAAILLCATNGVAQQKWTLEQCVQYAIENNISVKQADVQARIDKLTHDQSKLSLYPSASFQSNQGFRLGRSIDPTQNQFTTSSMFFSNPSLNADVELFNWFRKRNNIEANKLLAEAGTARLEKARNDIALNVANAYLAALLNKEQISIMQVQLGQSRVQTENIQRQVQAGALPELNLAEMETQMASDSASLINAKANYTIALLQLKALLNLDAATPFDIASPPVEDIPVEPLAALDPASVYNSAVENMPQQKINQLNLRAAEKNVQVARASMYPVIYAFGGLGSNYSSLQKVIPTAYEPQMLQIGNVNINGAQYPVLSAWPQDIPVRSKKGTYFNQMANNFNQNIGIGINVPIFNAGAARTNWKKAQLNVSSQQLLKDQDAQTLKQDIYQAHANAVAAIEQYNASVIALESAQKAYDFAVRRFEVGLLKPIDLIINQNNLSRSKINKISSQYDYVFKIKLLEFYKGKGIKL